MKRNTKIIILLLVIIFLIFLVFVLYYINKNTSLLGLNIEEEAIEKNNQNIIFEDDEVDGQEEGVDLVKLESKELIVPEKYREGIFSESRVLNLPAGFEISVFAAGMKAPRFFDFDNDDNMIVADKGAGKIYLIKDDDKDGVADSTIDIDYDLRVPHSVDYYEGDLYAGEEHQVIVYRDLQADGSYTNKEILVHDLPASSGHSTRTVLVGPDKKLYVSIGSSCNLCEEEDTRRAAIVRYNLDGSGEEVFASGLRNSVGIEFKGNKLWAVNNGRDLIGDDLPPEEVNIVEQGKHYGWPYCYGQGITNPEYNDRGDFCKNETEFPAYEMQAHSAPLGMSFSPDINNNFPKNLEDNLFIGFHGSWNRSVPTGYKVVRIDLESEDSNTLNFVTGFLDNSGSAWGRPVDVGFDSRGYMYISDDRAGAIYCVSYNK